MQIKITTLSENTANFGYIAEWGLSMLVEVDSLNILMDTGYSFSAVHNAQLMGIDLANVDKIVISHGHRDHTGGLIEILERRHSMVEVIAHPDIFSMKYTRRAGQKERYAGIPFLREQLEGAGAVLNLSTKPVYITEKILTTGEVPMITIYEKIESNLLVKEAEGFKGDPLADDLALIINADFGLVVVLGCAHHGVINTLRHAQELTGNKEIYAVIGGTHLFRADEERIERTISDIKSLGVQKLALSHCTGFIASARFAQEFGENFIMNNAGTRLTLP